MEEEKTAYKRVLAILKSRSTFTYLNVMYERDKPILVDVKTARYLKNTGLFKFEKQSR